jgi:hypothetical protein
MADVLSTVSIALLLAGKFWRNLPAVYDPTAFALPLAEQSVNSANREHISIRSGYRSNNTWTRPVRQ